MELINANNQVIREPASLSRRIRLFFLLLFVLSLLITLVGIYFFTKKSCENFFCFFSHPVLILASALLSLNLFILMTHSWRVVAGDSPSQPLLTIKEKFLRYISIIMVIYFVVLIYEMLIKGYTLLSSVLLFTLLMFIFIGIERYSVLSKYLQQYLFVVIATLIVVHYIRYTPSFGNDTWRDSIWAVETIHEGDYRPFSVRHGAYKIPIVVILYSIQSLVLGLDPLLTSTLTGLTYLLVISLLVSILITNKYASLKERGSSALFAMYATPLITLWSVWFIPQALSLIFILMILFITFIHLDKKRYPLTSEGIIYTLFIIMAIITHFGMGTLLLAYMTILSFNERFIRKFLIIGFIVYLSYVAYAVFEALLNFTFMYINDLFAILLGEERNGISITISNIGEGVLYVISPWLGPIIVVISTVNVILYEIIVLESARGGLNKMRARQDFLLMSFSLAIIAIAYIMILFNPYSAADRYLGVLPFVILIILGVPRGLILLKRLGLEGKVFVNFLIILLIIQIAFGGTFTPNNPLTANPNTYSIYGLIDYSERDQIEQISSLIEWGWFNLLMDWRSGSLLEYELASAGHQNGFKPLYRSFEYLGTHVIFARSYGYTVNCTEIKSFLDKGTLVLFRQSSIVMKRVWDINYVCIYLLYSFNSSLVYNSNSIIMMR